MSGAAISGGNRTRSPYARALAQALFLIVIALAAGALRQAFPGGIGWVGRWPTAGTTAEEAYRMVAQPGDAPFVSLSKAIALHNGGALFLDARSSDEFIAGHIPGARNLPFYEMEEFEQAALEGAVPGDRIVVYCEGVGCELSLFLARDLQARGFTDVNIFYGGFPEWQGAGLEIEK